MDFDFPTLLESVPRLFEGAVVTAFLSLICILIATAIGLILALLRVGKSKAGRIFAEVYVWIMRGIPLLLLLFFLYFGGPSFGMVLPAFAVAVIAISLNAGAYNSEVFRAAIEAISPTQYEGGLVVGLTRAQIMRRIILPQAARLALPTYINNAILLVKNSALVSVISVGDLLLSATQIYSSNFRPMEVFAAAGIYYLVMTSSLMLLQRWSELKLAAFENPSLVKKRSSRVVTAV